MRTMIETFSGSWTWSVAYECCRLLIINLRPTDQYFELTKYEILSLKLITQLQYFLTILVSGNDEMFLQLFLTAPKETEIVLLDS